MGILLVVLIVVEILVAIAARLVVLRRRSRAVTWQSCDLRVDSRGRLACRARGVAPNDAGRIMAGATITIIVGGRTVRMIVEGASTNVYTGEDVYWTAIDVAHHAVGMPAERPDPSDGRPRPVTPGSSGAGDVDLAKTAAFADRFLERFQKAPGPIADSLPVEGKAEVHGSVLDS